MGTVRTSPSLQELVQQKENEWREAQELQIKSLQSALKEKERQLNNEKLRFRKLKEDFASGGARYIRSQIEALFVTVMRRHTLQPRRRLGMSIDQLTLSLATWPSVGSLQLLSL